MKKGILKKDIDRLKKKKSSVKTEERFLRPMKRHVEGITI